MVASYHNSILRYVGLKIAFRDNDGNSMPNQPDSQPSSSRSRSNADFSNHTWVAVPDNGTPLFESC